MSTGLAAGSRSPVSKNWLQMTSNATSTNQHSYTTHYNQQQSYQAINCSMMPLQTTQHSIVCKPSSFDHITLVLS